MSLDLILSRALHAVQGSPERWSALRKTGADDDALRLAIAAEWGAGFGHSGAWFVGGNNPRAWLTGSGQGKPTLEGAKLLDTARAVLGIRKPGPVFKQETLFGEGGT